MRIRKRGRTNARSLEGRRPLRPRKWWNLDYMIGIFDSGVGGLSVLNEIHELLPAVPLLYFADSKNVPYGSKSKEFLRDRSLEISKFLYAQGAKLIVIACNTATAVAAEVIRESLSVPIVAVEPAVKSAVGLSKTGVIAVLATEVTLGSQRSRSLIDNYAENLRVIERASNDLVPIVENHLWQDPQARNLIIQVVDELLSQGVDTVVLGSTHFCFLKDSISELSQGRITPVGSSEAIAQQVVRVSADLFEEYKGQGAVRVVVSGDLSRFRENFQFFSDLKVEFADINSFAKILEGPSPTGRDIIR